MVPELTRITDINLNARVSLRHRAVTISLADDAGAPLEFCLCGRLDCRGGGLALVPVRLCRAHFQALNERKCDDSQFQAAATHSKHTPVASIVVLSCVAIVAAGALALIGWKISLSRLYVRSGIGLTISMQQFHIAGHLPRPAC